MKPPSELDALLRQARQAAEPSPLARSRVQSALLARIAAGDPGPPDPPTPPAPPDPSGPPGGPPAPSGGSGHQAGMSGGSGHPGTAGAPGSLCPPPGAGVPATALPKPVLLASAVVALGLATAGGLWLGRAGAPPSPASSAASAVASAASSAASTAAVASSAASAIASGEQAGAAASASGEDGAAPVGRPSSGAKGVDPVDLLREETAQLRQAQQALRGGQAARALTMLDEQGRLFARGVLGQERMVTRILALCALGRRGEAQRLGAAMERASPRSPHLTTLRNSCARSE